ncbi:MAG: TetR/AcrR family transcriptional regulator [Nocardioides sp.]|uniref:TetR/AcrR family transcriptional regulator n=1 Tax=Nocardioides sp. TaxID=35761 RepID=UPI003F05EBB0
MTSTEPDTSRDPQDEYLDAARDCILDVGWRRTTLTEVARRAGVSRMTIYRSWSDMGALLGDLMTREWAGIAAASRPATGRPTSLADLATALVDLVRALRDNELFVRIVELDPELLLPYLLSRPGRSQQALLTLLEETVLAGQEAGWAREGDPRLLARTMVLAGHGFVLSALTMVDDRTTLGDLDRALGDLVERALAPGGPR